MWPIGYPFSGTLSRISFLVPVVARVRLLTLTHLFPDLNPILVFGISSHACISAPSPLSTAAFLAVNVVNFTCVHLTDLLNMLLRSVKNNDVDKLVARHFNSDNHWISDMKVYAISPISAAKKQKTVPFLKLEPCIYPHGLNERFTFM